MALLLDLQQTWQELHTKWQPNLFLFSLLFFSSFIFLHKLIARDSKLKFPPSPLKLPIIGNLHQLGKLPHRSLRVLAAKYGSLMLLHVGHAPTLVVSSADASRAMMKTHDIVFSNRPKTTSAHIFLYGCKDVGFAPYGEYWRQVKKVSVVELLSLKRVQSFQFVREEEVAVLIDKIHSASLSGASVNLSEMLIAISNNITSRCVLGRKAEEEGGKNKFGELSRRMMVQFNAFSFGDVFPFLGWVDNLTGLVRKLKATAKEMDVLLDQVIEEHRISGNDDDPLAKKDFVHILLQLQRESMLHDVQLTQDNLKAILMDMFVGGTDTTSTVMEWAMARLIKHPNVMRRAQEEVRRIVGKKIKVEADDVDKMNYLKCVIKETLRLHPAAPILVPRESSASVEWGGYYIPAKTKVLVNAFAIQTDPKVWDRPEEFLPERFEGNHNPVDFKGQDFQFIPFGGGRRMCPGITFGVTSVEFVIANLLYWFDWKLPNGAAKEDLDMSEANGLTVHKKEHLLLVPKLYLLLPSMD